MINAWWHSNIRARAFACHARDDCGVVSSVCIVKMIFFFPFSFFSKKSQENKKRGYQVSPAVGGEETEGCMRPVLT